MPARLFSTLAGRVLVLSQLAHRRPAGPPQPGQQPRQPTPSLALVDAQSVKLAPRLRQQRGLDAHKRVNGRKRQVLCNTGGRIWQAAVHAANGHDSRAAHILLPARTVLRPAWASRLRTILTDKAYQGQFAQQAHALGYHTPLEVELHYPFNLP
jgi:hypothetical protein